MQRLIDWDVKGWFCACMVAYFSLKIYRLCKYTMISLAVYEQRKKITEYKEQLERQANSFSVATVVGDIENESKQDDSLPSAPPLDAWETIDPNGRLSPIVRLIGANETKETKETEEIEEKATKEINGFNNNSVVNTAATNVERTPSPSDNSDDEDICGICLENIKAASPFQEEERIDAIVSDTIEFFLLLVIT